MCSTDGRDGGVSRAGRSLSDGGRDPIDRILLALSDPRCRYLLYYLDGEGNAYIYEAARFIAACERGCDPADVPEDYARLVHRDLYHVHLPKLSANHIIDYDERSGAMSFQTPPKNLSEFLELASSTELSEEEIEKF